MPTLNELLGFVELLRIGVKLRTPGQLGTAVAHIANDFRNDDASVRVIVAALTEVVRAEYGEEGVAKFHNAYWRIAKR